MSVAGGAYTWLPCEVKPGPFSDERLVRVASELGDWVGFVPVSSVAAKRAKASFGLSSSRSRAIVPRQNSGRVALEHAVDARVVVPEVGGSYRGRSYLSFPRGQGS